MDRAKYNDCMSPYIRGSGKSKEERKLAFCIGAKLCSKKAKTEEEARSVCMLPKTPKLPKQPRTKKGKQEGEDICNWDNFYERASQFNDLYIDISSQSCEPCKELLQLISQTEIPYQIVTIPESCYEIAEKLGADAYPTVIHMRKGKVINKFTGKPVQTIEKMKQGE